MAYQQTIAIIGATGFTATKLAKAICMGSFRLLLLDENQAMLLKLKRDILSINRQAVVEVPLCCREASWEADIIIFALPLKQLEMLIDNMKEVATRKTVIFLVQHKGEVVAAMNQLPLAKLVTVFVDPLPDAGVKRIAFIEGEDTEAINTAVSLVMFMQYEPVVQNNKISKN